MTEFIWKSETIDEAQGDEAAREAAAESGGEASALRVSVD